MMSVSRRFCSIWKIRSCLRRPDEPSILRPSAISCSSVTDFRFNSAISTLCAEKGGLAEAVGGGARLRREAGSEKTELDQLRECRYVRELIWRETSRVVALDQRK